MLYSIGKDSSVMLHLALKAFYPERPPFPFLHVNTTWKFKEMIEFRDHVAEKYGLEMLEYINEEGVKQGINPFDHGSAYTDIMKTHALKQALDKYGFTAAFVWPLWGLLYGRRSFDARCNDGAGWIFGGSGGIDIQSFCKC